MFHTLSRIPEYQFDIVTLRLDPESPVIQEQGNIRVIRVGGLLARLTIMLPKALAPLVLAWAGFRQVRAQSYVALHAYQASQGAAAAALIRLVKRHIPLIVTLQEGKDLSAQSWLVRWTRAWVLRRADRVVAISEFLASYARSITKAPVEVIPNGVDIENFVFADPVSQPIVVTASRLVEKNNISNLLRAMACVRAHVPSVKLIVLGDGPLRRSLSELALQQRVQDIVTWRGSASHDEVARCVGASRVFVRASKSEGLGNAFLEAMASGVPVVASPVGGIVDFVVHEETGLLAKPHDVSDIARQIVRLLTDDALYEKIRINARRTVERRYTWPSIARALQGVYDRY